MIEAVMLWNEPNNLSHWNFKIDPDWKIFAETAKAGARAVRRACPGVKIVLGGISPIDPHFIQLLTSQGVIDEVDVCLCPRIPVGLEPLEAGGVAAEDRRNPCGDA